MSFTETDIQKVWEKGIVVPGYNAAVLRKDTCGAWIQRDKYGNRQSRYGWEIDHIRPVDAGGTDGLSNLRPLQWDNNAARQNKRLECPVTAEGKANIRRW
jgi:hypothetical protein